MKMTTHRICDMAAFATCALVMLVMFVSQPLTATAQWTTPDAAQNINNTNTGNVGVGTTTPVSPLHIASESTAGTRGMTGSQHSPDGNSFLFTFRKSRGTKLAPAAVVNGDSIFNLASEAYDGATYVNGGRIRFAIDGPVTSGSAPTAMQFFTGNNGSGIERMRINSAGNVGIGTVSPLARIHVQGAADVLVGRFENTNSTGYTEVQVRNNGGTDFDRIQFGIGGTATGNIYQNKGYVLAASSIDGLILQASKASGIVQVLTGGSTERMRIDASGNVGIGTATPGAKLEVVGNVNVSGTGNITAAGTIEGGTIKAKYQDIAEWVESSQELPTGTLVVLDPTKSNQVVASSQAYDTRVAGVISERPGIALGEAGDNKVLVATTGRVRLTVDATKGPIQIGDLLVTSDIPGVAMKSEAINVGGVQIHRPGTLIGKALEPLAKGRGEILVLLSLQ